MKKGLFLIFEHLLLGAFAFSDTTVHPTVSVSPTGKKLMIGNADDPAIWIHPTNKSRSVIIGSDKDEGSDGSLQKGV